MGMNPMSNIDLKNPQYYINRELSLLEFNRRVLAQAKDPAIPLLERLRFLTISCTNLDEFFEVRVAGLKEKEAARSVRRGPDNMLPNEVLSILASRSHAFVDEQYQVLNEELLPALKEQQINFIRRTEWNASQAAWLKKYFHEELQPVLSPMGLDSAHPFPKVVNKSLCFIVSLTGKDAFGRNSGLAVLQAPRSVPRVIQLPPDETESGVHDFVFLSSVIHAHMDELFHGMTVQGSYQFRVTRNSDLFVDDEEMLDLKRAIEGELALRQYGDEVRIEVADNCPPEMVAFLQGQFELGEDDVYLVHGPVNLNRLQTVFELINRPDLSFPPFTPGIASQLSSKENIFNAIAKRDLLLHMPFDSFAPVIELLNQAAADAQVLAIKQTLYRTGAKSAIADALVKAALAGKEVTVVVELRARFDEEANVTLATRLQKAGVHVVYGVVGYKTHAKMMLVIRREGKRLRYYTHLGTGNYHPGTARVYTDYGLFSANKQVGEDVVNVFNQLTSLGKVPKLNKLLHAPFTLQKTILEKIEREASNAAAGKPARIIAKMNSLTDEEVIKALYRASMAGVSIDLIIRGVCRLRPGIVGVSENIRVRSIIGRFLEHTRVHYFENGDSPEVFASSADWMERNLYQRVEVCFPIEAKALRERVIKDLNGYLKDNQQAWRLKSDASYQKVTPAEGEPPFSIQQSLLEKKADVV